MASDKTRQTASKTTDGTKLAYALWLVSRVKTPKTKTEWAFEHKVNRDTLWEWERSSWISDFIDKDVAAKKAALAEAYANLEWIATQRDDKSAAVNAIRELMKLNGKYPSEKIDVSVDRVAYVQPGALREHAVASFPELKN